MYVPSVQTPVWHFCKRQLVVDLIYTFYVVKYLYWKLPAAHDEVVWGQLVTSVDTLLIDFLSVPHELINPCSCSNSLITRTTKTPLIRVWIRWIAINDLSRRLRTFRNGRIGQTLLKDGCNVSLLFLVSWFALPIL